MRKSNIKSTKTTKKYRNSLLVTPVSIFELFDMLVRRAENRQAVFETQKAHRKRRNGRGNRKTTSAGKWTHSEPQMNPGFGFAFFGALGELGGEILRFDTLCAGSLWHFRRSG
jgi:hypothetical protein